MASSHKQCPCLSVSAWLACGWRALSHRTPGWAPTVWSCWLRAGPSSSAGTPWNQEKKEKERGHSAEQNKKSWSRTRHMIPVSMSELHAGSSWRVMSGRCYFQSVRAPCDHLTARLRGGRAALLSDYFRLRNSSRECMNQGALNINASQGVGSAAQTELLFSCELWVIEMKRERLQVSCVRQEKTCSPN